MFLLTLLPLVSLAFSVIGKDFGLDQILFTDIARAGHFLGLAGGLGLALCADALALKSIIRPVSEGDILLLRWLHRAILAGLALLWLSGLYLLQVRTGFDPANFSPKLIIKLVVVALLSANALAISLFALPCYALHVGKRFGDFGLGARLRLSAIGGLSLSCWLSALALGVFSQLKVMSFQGIETVLGPVFVIGFTGALLVGFGATALNRVLTGGQPDKWPSDRTIGHIQTGAVRP